MVERRTILKGAGVAGAAGLVGAGTFFASNSAAAQAEIGSFDIAGDTLTTDDGTISGFEIDATVSVNYDGLDTKADEIAVGLGVYGPDGGEHILASKHATVADTNSLKTNAGSLTLDFAAVDVLANSAWAASDFTDPTEGDGKEDFDLKFVALFEIADVDGNAITPGGQPDAIWQEGAVTVSVGNETSEASVGADGEVSLSGSDQDA